MIKLGEIWTGIRQRWSQQDIDDLAGPLWHNRRPKAQDPPFAVFNILAITPDWKLNQLQTPHELVECQFEIYFSDPDTTNIDDTVELIDAAYGISDPALGLPVDGYHNMWNFRRGFTAENLEEVWVYTLFYELMFEGVQQ